MNTGERRSGVSCPNCGETAMSVTDSRPLRLSGGAVAVMRRRPCKACRNQFKTYEVSAEEYDEMRHELRRLSALFDGIMTAAAAYK